MEVTLHFNIRPTFLSALLHGLLLLLALFFIYRNDVGSRQGSEPIQIESITQKPSAVKEKQTSRQKSTAPTRSAKNSKAVPDGITLGSLAMRMDYRTPTASAQDFYQPMPESHIGQAEPADDWDTMNPDPRVARFNQYIYNTVQGWLDRDAPSNHQMLTGIVKLRIWFSADGEYLEKETVFDAVDPNFQAIVERALRKSFMNPIPKIYLTQKKKFFIDRTVVLRN